MLCSADMLGRAGPAAAQHLPAARPGVPQLPLSLFSGRRALPFAGSSVGAVGAAGEGYFRQQPFYLACLLHNSVFNKNSDFHRKTDQTESNMIFTTD